jgi:hypothetical protein
MKELIMLRQVRVFLSIFGICLASACAAGGTSQTLPAPTITPPTPAAGGLSSLPAPSSVHIAEIAVPDAPAGSIAIGADASAYFDAAKHFVRYTGVFKEFPYPLNGADSIAAAGGVNSLAIGPGGTVWALIAPVTEGAPPVTALAVLSPDTGNIAETLPPLISLSGNFFASVTPANNGTMWVVRFSFDPRTGTNTSVEIFNASVTEVGEFLPPANLVDAETLGADGMMYVATSSPVTPSQIFQVNPSSMNLLKTVTLPGGSNVKQLASGPDRAVWFTDSGLNKIGRITSAGAVTYFSVPTSNSGLEGIAAGIDNAMWFTEMKGNRIGRISTDGSVTEYAVPTPNAQPQGITAGAPGPCIPNTIYFTEANALGKLTFSP